MTRGSHRREGHVQPDRPAPPPPPPAPGQEASEPSLPVSAAPLSPGWSLAAFLWISAFVALALFELLSALFRR